MRLRLPLPLGAVAALLALLDPCRPLAVDVAVGVMRLHSAHRVGFTLNGNAWGVAREHTVKLELVGRDAPACQPSNGRSASPCRGSGAGRRRRSGA